MRTKVSKPKLGDTRTKKGFLLFPKTIGNSRRWFEFAAWVQVHSLVPGPLPGKWPEWVNDHWIEDSEKFWV